ncbi:MULTISPECIES: recombinase family protein [unclassified Bradyrhizobium]|uniref:recombinase family protein n=1 Tax=unclassified Bradyrhizobium TaxID=2631580 RepID=UPI001FEEA149|nr:MULTISPECIES: recombinase family protein [unclassified Bradyrhizobium]
MGQRHHWWYKIVEAERRGQKIKKKLDIDPVEAETVKLIVRLYLEGDEATGPLGVKQTTGWLNRHGYRTRRGSTFGVGPIHKILTNTCYSTGLWPYGKRDSRNGGQQDDERRASRQQRSIHNPLSVNSTSARPASTIASLPDRSHPLDTPVCADAEALGSACSHWLSPDFL